MIDVLLNNSRVKSKPEGTIEISDGSDKPIKSLMKSVSWRIIGTLDTIIISYFITGKLSFALSIGIVEVITKTILYYFHERLWAHIHKIKLKLWKKTNGRKQYDIKRAESSTIAQNY
jgi:uncharacterized membrane protein